MQPTEHSLTGKQQDAEQDEARAAWVKPHLLRIPVTETEREDPSFSLEFNGLGKAS